MKSFEFVLYGAEKETYWKAESKDNVDEFARDVLLCFASNVNPETMQISISCTQISSEKLKSRILAFVEKYESIEPRIHRIRKFVSSLQDGEHFYFLPNTSALSREDKYKLTMRLMAQNSGRDPEKDIQAMEAGLGVFLKTYLIGGKSSRKKTAIGEPLKKKRMCRFCKNTRAESDGLLTGKQTKTTFRQEAHAISEALGNKTIILHEECDACNHYFSKTCEKHILTYLKFYATFFKVKNKDNIIPKIKGKNFELTYIGHEKDASPSGSAGQDSIDDLGKGINTSNTTKNTKAAKSITGVDFSLMYTLTDEERAEAASPPEQIPLKFYEKLSFQEIYKALVKFSLSVIETKNLEGFERTIEWLAGKRAESTLPKIAVLESYQTFTRGAELTVYRRLNEDSTLPLAVGEFQFTFLKFVFIIPTFIDTQEKFLSDHEYERFWSFFMFKLANGWKYQDFSDATEKEFILNMKFPSKPVQEPEEHMNE